MERHLLIKGLRSASLPDSILSMWPDVSKTVRQMTDGDPDKRPTTSSLLNKYHFYNEDKELVAASRASCLVDMIIESLQLELAERAMQITQLRELLKEKDMELEQLRNAVV